jgi:hypothetical protein
VRCSEPPYDAVFVFDILGNSSERFRQDDGGSSLPIKLNGSFHLMGELEMMQHKHVEQALSPIEHLYKNCLNQIARFSTLSSLDISLVAVALILPMPQTSEWRGMGKGW